MPTKKCRTAFLRPRNHDRLLTRWDQGRERLRFDKVVGQSSQHRGQVVTAHSKLAVAAVTSVFGMSVGTLMQHTVAQTAARRRSRVDGQLRHPGNILGGRAEGAE